jgi:hypothetical protein
VIAAFVLKCNHFYDHWSSVNTTLGKNKYIHIQNFLLNMHICIHFFSKNKNKAKQICYVMLGENVMFKKL